MIMYVFIYSVGENFRFTDSSQYQYRQDRPATQPSRSRLLRTVCLDMYARIYPFSSCMFVWICLHMCVCVSDLLLSVSCAQACAFHIASRLVEMQQLPWGCRWGTTLGRPASLVLLLTKVVMLTALVSTKVRLSTEPEGLWNICRSNCRQIDIDQRITTALLVCMCLCMLLCMCACVAWHVCMCVFASVCACVRAYLHEYSVCTLTLTLQMYPLATTTAPPTTGCMHACIYVCMSAYAHLRVYTQLLYIMHLGMCAYFCVFVFLVRFHLYLYFGNVFWYVCRCWGVCTYVQ